MGGWQLAQINVGRMYGQSGDAVVQGFYDELDRINAIADAAPGFVWRLTGDGGNATDLRPTPDPLFLINMSTWDSAEALFDYVYRSGHVQIMAHRKKWFERFEGAFTALWWVSAGHRPSIHEGLSRLWMLDRYGPSAHAFTFKARFPVPDEIAPPVDMKPDPWCVGWA